MAALRRARLVLLSLALMAGILGMHVMALAPMDGHVTTAETSAAGVMGGAAHSGPSQNPGHSDHAGMHSMDPSCTPAAKSASLEAPLPGTGFAVATPPAGEPVAASGWSYLPGSPSPGVLCISRT